MSGLDKLIARIQEDAAKRCEDILAEGESRAAALQTAAKTAAEQTLADGQAALAAQREKHLAMEQSKAQQLARQTLLAARVQAVEETLQALLQTLHTLPDAAYFAALRTLVQNNAMPGEGTLQLSEADLARLPADFITSLQLDAGKTVTLQKTAAAIADGFLLTYGDITVNCTFAALADAEQDALKDVIGAVLFAQ